MDGYGLGMLVVGRGMLLVICVLLGEYMREYIHGKKNS
jgi:hypothetical protein